MDKNQYGTLVFDGILLDIEEEVPHLLNSLNNSVENCIEAIKELDGQFSLVWKTPNFSITATDFSLTHFLYNEKTFELLEPNTIYIFDNEYNVVNKMAFFEGYSSISSITSYESLYDAFEKNVYRILKKDPKPSLFVSDGIDSGAIHCAFIKTNKSVDIFSGYQQDAPLLKEDMIKRRQGIHRQYFNSPFLINKFLNVETDDFKQFRSAIEISPSDRLAIVGCNADRIFVNSKDYENYWMPQEEITMMQNIKDVFDEYNQRYFDFFATKNIVKEWFKIAIDKRNLKYKEWMIMYCNMLNYPNFENLKNGKEVILTNNVFTISTDDMHYYDK